MTSVFTRHWVFCTHWLLSRTTRPHRVDPQNGILFCVENWFLSLQAKLVATQQERDMALARVRKQDEELQNLRVYYR